MLRRYCPSSVIVAVLIFGCATLLRAQTNGGIAGRVTDSTGAVLPGVTIEASSPALIEKVRTVTTDTTGQYKIVELVPGTYTVTFTLQGFSSVRREGIVLTTGFTANVAVELQVGEVSETLTVSGQSPTVDAQNVVQQRVMTRDVIDAVPTAKNYANLGVLIPGTTISGYGRVLDVGGSEGNGNQMLAIHGGRITDQSALIDGMSVGMLEVSAAFPVFTIPDGSTQEVNFTTGAQVAEQETGGVRVNMIPKSGGNRFTGFMFGNYAGGGMSSSNLTDDLRARGVTATPTIDHLFAVNPALGGPILADKLWFYAGYQIAHAVTNSILRFNENPGFIYTPDLSRPSAQVFQRSTDENLRLTWQISPKDKIEFNTMHEDRCRCDQGQGGTTEPLTMPEADLQSSYPSKLLQATWTRPSTNRLLFEAGFSASLYDYIGSPEAGAVGPPALDLATGFQFRSRSYSPGLLEGYYNMRAHNYVARGSMSYVTGSHAFKLGLSLNPGETWVDQRYALGNYLVVLLNGAPVQVQYFAFPYNNSETMWKTAAYAQDQWTVNHLTVNAGLRFDQHKSGYNAVSLPATAYLPARSYPAGDVLNWKDLDPRLGASYDLFGNGKTALKASLSRYVAAETTATARAASPAVISTVRLTRSWNDTVPCGNPAGPASGDCQPSYYIPQGDPLNPAPNGELGPSTNVNWGLPVTTTHYDPGYTDGWGKRGYNWETQIGIQHELAPRVSVTGTYVRRQYGNFVVTDNLAADVPSDYSPYCITAPSSSALPNGGGQQICGLYDIIPSKLGQINNLVTLASHYGNQYEHWQGIDVSVDARLPDGVLLQGGFNEGRTVTDNCDVVTKIGNPSPLYCHQALPFLPNVKLLGALPLPSHFQVAATFQSIPGNPVQANFVATNAQIAPSLGRNLAAGPNGTVAVNVVTPGQLLSDRVNQLDLRLSRTFRLGRSNLKGMLDLYNSLNANPVIAWNNTYGTTGAGWQQPLQILTGRLAKLSAQLTF